MTATMIIIQAGASQIYMEVELTAAEPAYHVVAVSNMQALVSANSFMCGSYSAVGSMQGTFAASSLMCNTFNAASHMTKSVQFTER
jgi:hypothetical protein